MALKTTVKKKPTTNLGRKSITAEERHVGLETVNWVGVRDVESAVYDTLRHYNYFYDLKDGVKWVEAWIKKNMTKEDLVNYQAAENWRTSMTAAGLCKMHMNGAPFDSKRIDWVKGKVAEAIAYGKANKNKVVTSEPTRQNPADIIKQRTSDFIADVENVLDDFYRGVWVDSDSYSVYNELKKIDAPSNTAKGVFDYYTRIKEELEELLQKKTPDLVEAYAKMTLAKKREYLKLIVTIVDDAQKYMNSKKAVRKTRVAKPKSATQQIAKIQYLKEHAEYKITSIDPTLIVGASELYLFNVKYRTLARVVSQSASGFGLKGTTLQGIDLENSTKKMIRKPDETLKTLMSLTKAKASKFYTDIKTTANAFTGRINTETIILKAYK